MRALLPGLLVILVLWPGLAWAEGPVDRVVILEAGVFSSGDAGVPDESGRASTGLLPLLIVNDSRLLERTDRVEARLCVRFGIRYATPDLPEPLAAKVTIRVTHPVVRRPDGVEGTVESWETTVGQEPRMSGFEFDERWEAIPGRWTFEVVSGETVLAAHGFDVVPPGPVTRLPAGALPERCGAKVSYTNPPKD